ncbi:MAG: elongation factor P [bacterium]|nr:elongation factor P [bacterium]MDZ4248078.1 elongation factor P [Patescibacteria group bacterium]
MYGITNLRTNTKIELDGEPYVVLEYQHAKMGRGGAVVRTKLRNLKTGATLQKTFQGNDKVKPASLQTAQGQFLFRQGDALTFMDAKTYEQHEVPAATLGKQAGFLVEGMTCELLLHGGKQTDVIGVELPIKTTFEVTETDPGLKGDTAQGGTKPAVIASGAKVTVPLFVQTGDKIVVDTRTGAYVERG